MNNFIWYKISTAVYGYQRSWRKHSSVCYTVLSELQTSNLAQGQRQRSSVSVPLCACFSGNWVKWSCRWIFCLDSKGGNCTILSAGLWIWWEWVGKERLWRWSLLLEWPQASLLQAYRPTCHRSSQELRNSTSFLLQPEVRPVCFVDVELAAILMKPPVGNLFL